MLDDTIPNTDSNIPIPPASQPDLVQPVLGGSQVPPPPAGDSQKAEKYLNQLINLINQDKLKVVHTDLNKFNIDSIQDHYRMDLGEYEVEINHSKQPDSGQDIYVLLFNNLKKIEREGESCVNKVILAYIHLTKAQFENFKQSANEAQERKRLKEEQTHFIEVMTPIDDVLSDISSSSVKSEVKEQENNSAPIQETKFNGDEDEEEQDVDLADFADEPKEDSSEPKASDFPSSSQSSF